MDITRSEPAVLLKILNISILINIVVIYFLKKGQAAKYNRTYEY